MTAPKAIQGNRGSYLSIDGVEYDTDAIATRIEFADKDESDLTFEEAANGQTQDGSFIATFLQSLAASSLWRKVWDAPGDEYAVIWGLNGNAVPTVADPHLLFTMKAKGKPGIGATARFSSQRENTEYTWEITSEITEDDGS